MQQSASGQRQWAEQTPLGDHPSADQVIDVAVEYTFPASDAIAIGAGVHAAEKEQRQNIGKPAIRQRPAKPGAHEFNWPTGHGR